MRIGKWPYGYRMAVAIRDDDTSYFTNPDQIETLYGKAFDLGFKVCLATIPFHKGTDDPNVHPKYRNTLKEYDIADNVDLIKYLLSRIESNRIDVAQHGITHEGNSRFPEMRIFNDKVLTRIEKGKSKLEECFHRPIQVFVPPWEELSINTLQYVRNKNMMLSVASAKLWHYMPLTFRLKITPSFVRYIISKNPKYLLEYTQFDDITNIAPLHRHYPVRFRTDRVANETFHIFTDTINDCYAKERCMIIAVHYWDFFSGWSDSITNHRLYQYLIKILEFVGTMKNVWKPGLSEINSWLKVRGSLQISKRRAANGTSTIIKANQPIKGLTVYLSDKDKVIDEAQFRIGSHNEMIFDLAANSSIEIFSKD